MSKAKDLELERLVFFSDAVVAIAITLLALELKLENVGEELTFSDVWHAWPHFLSFFVSFIIIGLFWKTHHQFFAHIAHINERLLGFNMFWLFFITLLPFSTSLLSEHIFNRTAVALYCTNVLLISFFQNLIWDYACNKMIIFPGGRIKNANEILLKAETDNETITLFRSACNIQMINALLALIAAFVWAPLAVFILFSRIFFFRQSAVQRMNRKLKRSEFPKEYEGN